MYFYVPIDKDNAPGVKIAKIRATGGDADSNCPGTFLGQFDADMWFTYTATCDGTVTIDTCDINGIDTDLAVEGDGMFILTDGTRDFYTRDGTFAFDVDGRLVDPTTGFVVKGNLANDTVSASSDPTFEAELKELFPFFTK